MKKLFTLVALLACFLGANAKTVVDVNVNFAEETELHLYGWAGNPGDRLSLQNGCLHFKNDEATENGWDVQFFPVPNVTEVEVGVTYKLEFKIKGSVEGPFWNIGFAGGNHYQMFTVPTEWTVMEYDYEATSTDGGVLFQCGQYVGEWDIEYIKITHEEEEQEKPVEWENIVTNGDASAAWEKPEMSGKDEAFGTICAWSKEFGTNMIDTEPNAEGNPAIPAVHPAYIEDGVFVCRAKAVTPIMYYATDGETSWGSKWSAGDEMPNNTWQNQFWIAFPRAMKDGEQVKVSFKYKSSKAVTVSTQDHTNPGDYLGGGKLGNISFGTDWETFEKQFSAAAGVQSIAFNVTGDGENWKEDIDFFFDDITVSLMKLENGFFVASQNKANGIAFNRSNATAFEEQDGLMIATVGEMGKPDTYVDELMISTVRGENKSFNSAALKVAAPETGIQSGEDNWYDYTEAANAIITLPKAGVWQIMIDTEGKQMSFIMLETTGISEVVNKANTGSAVVYNLAGQRVSKDYKGIVVKNGKKVVVK